jgi:transposase
MTRAKVSGIKRHLAVDTQGLPHAGGITTAEVTDRDGALAAFDRCTGNLKEVKSVLVDGGYTGKPFAEAVNEKLGATVQVAKRNELHPFEVIPQRWVVERSFAWIEKCRRLWKNCERKLNTSYQMVHIAFLSEDREQILRPKLFNPVRSFGRCDRVKNPVKSSVQSVPSVDKTLSLAAQAGRASREEWHCVSMLGTAFVRSPYFGRVLHGGRLPLGLKLA